MKKSVLLFILISLFACNNQKKNHSTINKKLEAQIEKSFADQILKSNIDSALVLVMDVHSGEMKAALHIRKESGQCKVSNNIEHSFLPTTLALPFSMMAVLETGRVKTSDSVDTQNGIFVENSMTVTDNNYNKGGYGKIAVGDILHLSSYVGMVLAAKKAFPDSTEFISQLEKMSLLYLPRGVEKNRIRLVPQSIGMEFPLSPLQIISAYNAIANKGKMVAAHFNSANAVITNRQICSEKTLKIIQQLLLDRVNRLMSKQQMTNVHQFAGSKQGQGKVINNSISETFCGYFPYEKPQFTCMMVLHRKELDSPPSKKILELANELADICKKSVDN